MHLTEYELQMMHVIWRAQKPITSTGILLQSADKGWKSSTLHQLINQLAKKGYIREDSIVREGRAFARTFVPLVSCAEYYSSFLQSAAKEADVPMLFAALLKNVQPDEAALSKLHELLDEWKRGM